MKSKPTIEGAAESTSGPDGLIPLTKWDQYYQWPPIGGLRHLRFHQATNGFERAFVKCGKTVLIDSPKFWAAVKRDGGAR